MTTAKVKFSNAAIPIRKVLTANYNSQMIAKWEQALCSVEGGLAGAMQWRWQFNYSRLQPRYQISSIAFQPKNSARHQCHLLRNSMRENSITGFYYYSLAKHRTQCTSINMWKNYDSELETKGLGVNILTLSVNQ